MCQKSEEFRSIMNNLWLAEPISHMGKMSLANLEVPISIEEYLKELYVPPFTIFDKLNSDSIDNDQDIEREVSYYSIIQRQALVDEQNDFEQSLASLDKSLFLISGGPGCGKSTYVNHLNHEEKMLNTHFIVCNFEDVKPRFTFFGDRYVFPHFYEGNVWKYISIIVLKIGWILDRYEYRDIAEDHVDYIQKIYDCYQKHFFTESPEFVLNDDSDYSINDLESMEEFFQQLAEYPKDRDRKRFRDKMCACINSRLCNNTGIHHSAYGQEALKEEVSYFSGILIRIFFCLSRIYEEKGKNQKFLLVIDNIESFIRKDQESPIQDGELEIIINGIGKAIEEIRTSLHTMMDIYNNGAQGAFGWAEKQYHSFYGFLLVTRLSTISLIESAQYDDFPLDKEINISKWFYIDDIYQRKEEFFETYKRKLKSNPFYIAFRNILSDTTPFYWCTHDLLNRMYNNNYRRIGLDLVQTIAKQPESTIEDFNRKWNESNSSGNSAIKHMCRIYIFRILLDNIQQTGFFDDLMVEQKGYKRKISDSAAICSANSFARKIATILSREYIDSGAENNYTNMHFIPLVKLAEEILSPPNLPDYEVPDSQLENLGKVLYLMNETRYVATHWAPLINIKYDNERDYTKQNFISGLKRQWKNYCDNGRNIDKDMNKYGVRITMAGIFFAKMVPEFEYFACRYAPRRPALFVEENLRPTTESKESYNCIELIKIVRTNAFQCVDEILTRDQRFFCQENNADDSDYSPLFGEVDGRTYRWHYQISETQNNRDRDHKNLKAHPLRILDSHVGYLSNYKQFVESLTEKELSKEDKNKICRLLNVEIGLYLDKKEDVMRLASEYFMQENNG